MGEGRGGGGGWVREQGGEKEGEADKRVEGEGWMREEWGGEVGMIGRYWEWGGLGWEGVHVVGGSVARFPDYLR